jgi:FKBP-type peptidyl-prolyl cis-trans isomerase FkpA
VFPRIILFALLAAALTLAQNQPAAQHAQEKQTTTMTDEQKTIYAIGLSISRSLTPLDLSPAELDILKQALSDGAAGKPAIDLQEWGPKIKELSNARGGRALEKQKTAAKAYLDKMATEPGANKTESGLVYKILTAGEGTSPTATDTVKVNYRGTLVDGTEFDSSYKRNEPATFPLNGVVPCWTEGLQKMKPGSKAILGCPSDLAYGDAGRPSIPGGAALIFEIELLEVNPGAQPPTPGTTAPGQTTPPGQTAPPAQ